MERSKRKKAIPYKLRDFHIELTNLRHQIRDNPEQEKAKLTDPSCTYSHTQIRNELLYNFEKETSPKQGQGDLQQNINENEDSATEVEWTHHESAIGDTKPVNIAPANSFAGKVSPIKLPGDWRILEINELATEVENCGVEPEIISEHLIQNHSNITKKIKSEEKSIVLPSNWRDKIRDELIEDLCSENKFGKELLDSELQQSEPVSTSPTTLKLPTEWRTEELDIAIERSSYARLLYKVRLSEN